MLHRTSTGQPIDYSNPSLTEVLWDDIEVQLDREVRYGGARDINVLTHSALCVELGKAYGLPKPALGYIAAHDLHEYVVGDVPSALKALLPEYHRIEELWAAHVHTSLGLAWPVSPELAAVVKHVDRRALVVEMAASDHPGRQDFEVQSTRCTDAEMWAMHSVLQQSRHQDIALLRWMVQHGQQLTDASVERAWNALGWVRRVA